MRVLIVEDYAPLRESISQAFSEAGYATDCAADGAEGLWHAQGGGYDALVLDIGLPQRDGLSVLRALRDAGVSTPVLLLTARDAVNDRVRGLDLGADDYLVKPFALEELLARVRALVRREYRAAQPVLRVADLEINTLSRSVTRGDRNLELTAREYALLEYLAHRAGHVVSRSEIQEHVYDFAAEIGSNVIDVYVGYLRKKLEQGGGSRLIHTRRGLGYVLE